MEALARVASRPSIAGREVWFFSTVPWDFSLHGRTRALAEALRALGARVAFVEPPSPRAALRRLRSGFSTAEGVELLTMPPTVQRWTDRVGALRDLHDRAQNLLLFSRLAGRAPFAVVSTPRWAPALDGLEFAGVFYDCLDDLAVHAEPARLPLFEAWERRLLARCAGSFAVSPSLVGTLRDRGARNVLLHGNGVWFDEFRRRGEPPDPKGPRKRIGYVGAIYEWVDVELLAALARALPEHELTLVGPVRRGVDVSALSSLPNVSLPGYRAYERVPRAMASFDVALIPFKEGAVARAADPIKVYEYFCFGTPVVTTPVGDVESLGELLYVASGAQAFISATRAALAEDRPELRRRRMEYARANDWRERASTMADALLSA